MCARGRVQHIVCAEGVSILELCQRMPPKKRQAMRRENWSDVSYAAVKPRLLGTFKQAANKIPMCCFGSREYQRTIKSQKRNKATAPANIINVGSMLFKYGIPPPYPTLPPETVPVATPYSTNIATTSRLNSDASVCSKNRNFSNLSSFWSVLGGEDPSTALSNPSARYCV